MSRPLLITATLLLATIVTPCRGDALEHVVPRLDRETWGRLLQQLELESQQRLIAELAFTDYLAGLNDLAEQADAASADVGGERLAAALAGRATMSPHELAATQVEVWRSEAGVWPQSDALLTGLLESLEGLLTDEQRRRADSALVDLRRELWLTPRRATAMRPEYAGDGVDLIELVERARADGNELAGLDEASLAAVLGDYATRVDALLAQDAVAERAGRHAMRVARVRNDLAELRRLEREATTRWRRLYAVNDETATRIGVIAAEQLGEETRRRWRARVLEATFPWLHRDARPDRLYAAIRVETTDVERRRRATAAYEQYRRRRDELIGRIASLVVEARVATGRLVHPMSTAADLAAASGGPELHRRLLQLSGEREALVREAAAAMQGG